LKANYWKSQAIFGKDNQMRTYLFHILAVSVIMSFFVAMPVGAAEKPKPQDENIWSDDQPTSEQKLTGMAEEITCRLLDRIARTDPEKAEYLKRLAKENPEQFRAELKKLSRDRFGRDLRGRKDRRFPRGRLDSDMPFETDRFGPGGGGRHMKRGMGREHMRARHAELLEWLKENYPEKAEKLAQLQDENPKLYMRKLMLCMKKYGRIAEASRSNPQLAEILKEDFKLKKERNKLLREIAGTADDEGKKQLTGQLEQTVASRFDLIVKRKQIAHKQLRAELEKLQQKVQKREAELKKWKEIKDQKVKQRIKELISRTEKFSWE
jgi:hypothetical protein